MKRDASIPVSVLIIVMFALIGTACASDATAEEITVLAQRVEATGYANRYGAYYLEQEPEEAVKKMEEEHRASLQNLVRLDPTNPAWHLALGDQYILDGEADKAAVEYAAVLALPNLGHWQQADALNGLASAALLKGDRVAAVKHCEELLGRNLNTRKNRSRDPVAQARRAVTCLSGDLPDLDFLKLPVHTNAMAFPTPQQANYSEEFIPLTAVKLVLGKDISPDDVRIGLLRIKFDRFGIKFEDGAPFVIQINAMAEPKAPEKAEGYALTVSRAGAIINGYDAQGTLWGIVSLLQLVDHEAAPKIRISEILDYPLLARRGFLSSNWDRALEYMLFCKMNMAVWQGSPQQDWGNPTRFLTPLEKEVCAAQSKAFTTFGLTLYHGLQPWTMFYVLPLSSERTFALHAQLCTEIAKSGGHVYFPYDDMRFPLPKADLDKFGSAANMDAQYLTRLYREVRKEYPNFRMIFCPPFYWGPDSQAAYPEPREPYLKSIGEFLDPGIEIFWTGPRVKSEEKTKAQVDWYSGLVKRKPVIFQNGTGRHNLIHYYTDAIQWKKWHYDGFVEHDLDGYLMNSFLPSGGTEGTTLGDYLWNPAVFDAETSIRRGVAMLLGREMFDLLDPANQALAYLDKYPYGQITPEAMTEIVEIEKRVAIAEEAWTKALAYNAFSLEQFPDGLSHAIGWGKNALNAAKNAPDFLTKYAKELAETRGQAEKEVGIDEVKGDIYKSPLELFGGNLLSYATNCPKRFAALMRGNASTFPKLRATFACDPFPPSGPYILHLCAQDDEVEAGFKLRISVNGTTVFEGPSTFVRNGWSVETFTLPFESLKRGNELLIESLEDSSKNTGVPWFMVNYAVIKKSAQ